MPIKVLHLLTPGFGGIDAYVFSHYKYMDQAKFQFDFLTRNRMLECAEQYQGCHYKVHLLPTTADLDREQFVQCVKEAISNPYDVFHIHTSFWTGFLLEELAKEAGIKKVIVHAHSTFIDESDPQKRDQLMRQHREIKEVFSPELATDFWACSRLAAEWLFGPRISRKEIRIMKNAIELERFRFDQITRNMVRAELGFDQNTIVLGTAGRMAFQKNHAFLIDMFSEFHKKHPESKLIILGGGELQIDIERQIQDNNLEQDVFLLGWRTDIENYLSAMDVFVLPSKFEGFPVSLVEAAASGLPCVISDQISSEAVFMENIWRIPLSVPVWKGVLEEAIQIHIDRQMAIDIVRENGFDVKRQAKELELLYEA